MSVNSLTSIEGNVKVIGKPVRIEVDIPIVDFPRVGHMTFRIVGDDGEWWLLGKSKS
jgi:hypothetical protein